MRAMVVLLVLAASLPAQNDVIVIRGARVVDGTGAPARLVDVRIRGSKIEAVGTDIGRPAGARVIEAGGQTMIPGLFDLHTHLSASAVGGVAGDWGRNLKAYLAAGVTTVNDYATYGEMFEPMQRLLAGGAVPGPRVNMAYRFSTTGGHGTEGGWGDFMTFEVNTPEQAHARMKTALAYKPGVIKVFTDGWRYGTASDLTSMNLETLRAIVTDAHAAGIKVVTHTVTLGGAKIAARAGVDVLVHGIGDNRVDDELAALMKTSGTAYVSTLAVYENKTQPPTERALTLLDSAARALVSRRAAAPAPVPARQRRWENLLSNVRQLQRSGVAVAVGTDAGMTGTYHGFATLHELELLVESGFTPLEAIAAGTSASARAMGVEAERGTIAAGKLADLALIDGRPDEKISDIVKTARVFLGGREFDPRKLEASIQAGEATPIPVRAIPPSVDDMEQPARTLLHTLRVNSTDAGVDHSKMMYLPVVRKGQDHALLVTAWMAARERPWVRLELPLTKGAVDLADISRYSGVSFDVRGEAASRLLAYTSGAGARDAYGAPFAASAEWQNLKIPFEALKRGGEGAAWNPRAVRALVFELSGAPESTVWLELDNVRLY